MEYIQELLSRWFYRLTLVGPFRQHIRRLVYEAVNEWFNSIRREALAEVKKMFQEQLGSSQIRREIRPQMAKPYRLLDENYEKPTTVVAYIDLRALERNDEARVALFVGIRGDRDEDLVQVASNTYEGPLEEAVTIGPMVTCGRTVITYNQIAGEMRPIWIQAHTSAVTK